MRKAWTVCRTAYREWLFRQQTLMIFPILVFLYINVIEPMQYYADVMQTPLNLLEPFLCILNSVYAVPLLPLSYLFLFAGYPKLTGASVHQISRTGKRTWFIGQCMFLLLAICTFLLCIFAFSCICVTDRAFLANGWSIAARQIHGAAYRDLELQSGTAVIDLSVLNQIRPYQALLLCAALQILYMCIAALIDFCFTLSGHKLTGVLVNLITAGLGLFLLLSDTPFKWLMPAAHAVFSGHSDGVRNTVYMPVRLSFLFDGILLAVLFAIGFHAVRRCSLMTVLQTEGGR